MYIGKIGHDESVPCATCHKKWKTSYLVNDLGQQRLRQNGFAYIWFDDGAICVNYCPDCEKSQPAVPIQLPQWLQIPLAA